MKTQPIVMIELPQLGPDLSFPENHFALDEPNGLLAFGGDLTVQRLLAAYQSGIFPWFSEDEPILWWSPDPRGVVDIRTFSPSKSLRKFIRKQHYQISINMQFDAVIDACANVPRADSGTWITEQMIDAYKALHKAGQAHSIEVWDDSTLIGGLYGVVVGRVFCGESMFHTRSNSSKFAFWQLIELLKSVDAKIIDCQMQNPHLQSLDCQEISRNRFLHILNQERQASLPDKIWHPRFISAVGVS